jgi:NO-binding membrane sensor protein with MHYT domain
VVQVHNFAYGILNPGLAYLMSCLGCFLGLQCAQRARAMEGAARTRWLLLAAVSIGATGIWVMHFVAMLGFTINEQVIQYNVPITILSMLIAVAVVAVGLLIVGFGGEGPRPLLVGGTILGVGVAGMHYMGMFAMRMPDALHWNVPLVILSVIIAVVAGTAALWAALRLHGGVLHTLVAALIMGVAVSGMHYTGMAALHVFSTPGGGMASMGGGVGATSFLLPLILGISILTFLVTAIVTLAPTPEEIREDAALMERIATLSAGLGEAPRRHSSSRHSSNGHSSNGHSRSSNGQSPSSAGSSASDSIWGKSNR